MPRPSQPTARAPPPRPHPRSPPPCRPVPAHRSARAPAAGVPLRRAAAAPQPVGPAAPPAQRSAGRHHRAHRCRPPSWRGPRWRVCRLRVSQWSGATHPGAGQYQPSEDAPPATRARFASSGAARSVPGRTRGSQPMLRPPPQWQQPMRIPLQTSAHAVAPASPSGPRHVSGTRCTSGCSSSCCSSASNRVPRAQPATRLLLFSVGTSIGAAAAGEPSGACLEESEADELTLELRAPVLGGRRATAGIRACGCPGYCDEACDETGEDPAEDGTVLVPRPDWRTAGDPEREAKNSRAASNIACSVVGTSGTESRDEAERVRRSLKLGWQCEPEPALAVPECWPGMGADRRDSSSIERREMSPRGSDASGAPMLSPSSVDPAVAPTPPKHDLCFSRGWMLACSQTSELVREMVLRVPSTPP
eukprot:scaffold11430_cov134-Isochrysis_galbana.AAC.1